MNPPKGLGFIIRTAGAGRTKRELSRDLAYLLRLWKVIVRRVKKCRAPVDIYEESDMIIRTIRDIFSSDVDVIHVDESRAFDRAKEFLQMVMPRHVGRLQLYRDKDPLFNKYNLEDEISMIHQREVPLKKGGSIVIDQTEALVAIDVNSGNFRANGTAEESAFQINQLAAKEIARQLRLRDLGGVVVNDFIDMRQERHRRGVERVLREAVKRDRARTKILRTSPFGLIEMTRQRIRPGLKRSIYRDCPSCDGSGVVKTPESMAIEAVRMLMTAATYLNNRKRQEIAQMELEAEISVQILGKEGFAPEQIEIVGRNKHDQEIQFAGI